MRRSLALCWVVALLMGWSTWLQTRHSTLPLWTLQSSKRCHLVGDRQAWNWWAAGYKMQGESWRWVLPGFWHGRRSSGPFLSLLLFIIMLHLWSFTWTDNASYLCRWPDDHCQVPGGTAVEGCNMEVRDWKERPECEDREDKINILAQIKTGKEPCAAC